jgi:hypothetical protein
VFESLASCFAFRCSASLNSPQDESAVADITSDSQALAHGFRGSAAPQRGLCSEATSFQIMARDSALLLKE